MDDWCTRIQEFVDGIASSVAVVGRSAEGGLVVTACNADFFGMAGGRPPMARGFPVSLDAMIPSYVRRELRAQLLKCFETGEPEEVELAFDLKDGTHWWRLTLKPFRHLEADGTVMEILITGLDITTRMLLTQELEVSTSRFRLVVDAAYDAIVTIDQQQRITLFNRAAERLFGYDQDEMIGQPLETLLPEPAREVHRSHVSHFALSPVRSRQMDERNLIHGRQRDGTLIPIEIAISKIQVNGVMEFTAVIRDIADRVRLMELLQRQAETDELTSLFNRRAFTDLAQTLLPPKAPLALLVIDVDHFKQVNDTHGHDRGDEVLRMMARMVTQGLRRGDIFARMGGEEFAVLLPGATVAEAEAVAEKLRRTLETQGIDGWKGTPIPFTVSIGVTACTEADRDVWPALKRADTALYAAKKAGRNRVVVG